MSVARVWALPGLGGMGRLRAEFAAGTQTPHPSHRKKQALPAVHPNSKPWIGSLAALTSIVSTCCYSSKRVSVQWRNGHVCHRLLSSYDQAHCLLEGSRGGCRVSLLREAKAAWLRRKNPQLRRSHRSIRGWHFHSCRCQYSARSPGKFNYDQGLSDGRVARKYA